MTIFRVLGSGLLDAVDVSDGWGSVVLGAVLVGAVLVGAVLVGGPSVLAVVVGDDAPELEPD
jgi:uncharacterized membrane protein YedE/YeeE